MSRRMVPLLIAFLLLASGAGLLVGRDAASSAPLTQAEGLLRLIDGDTFDLEGRRIRLHGVDVPEDAQTCRDAQGLDWACGDWATAQARALWEGRAATCDLLETDRYGREVSRCEVAGEDLGAGLVERGLALAYVAYSDDYLPQQHDAEAARRGLWAGSFEAPWDWRRNRRSASAETVPDCAIKGNISERGRIYHLPGGPSYEVTRIDPSRGERWFCTAQEAEAAGWQPRRG